MAQRACLPCLNEGYSPHNAHRLWHRESSIKSVSPTGATARTGRNEAGMRDDDRIVVTGLGAVTPIGNTVDDFWKSLTEGVSGVGRITQFDPSELTVQIAAEVKGFDLVKHFDKKEAGRLSR